MLKCLMRVVLLGIEIEIFILLWFFIKESSSKQSKRRRRRPSDFPPKRGRSQIASADPVSEVGQTEQPAHPLADSLEPGSPQESVGTPESPDASQDISSGEDNGSVKNQEDTCRETVEGSIKKKLTCGIVDLNSVNGYSSQARLVEMEGGEIQVLIMENGSVCAEPSSDITTERLLNDVFRLFFEFDMPTQLDAKKFRITCEREAGLTKNNQSFCLLSKGRLKVDVD